MLAQVLTFHTHSFFFFNVKMLDFICLLLWHLYWGIYFFKCYFFKVPVSSEEKRFATSGRMKNVSAELNKSSNGNFGIHCASLGVSKDSGGYFTSTKATYKTIDLRFHMPSGFNLGEGISEISFKCWLSCHRLWLYVMT